MNFLESLIVNGYASVEAEPGAEPSSGDVSEAAGKAASRPRPAPPRVEDLDLAQLWLHITSRCNLRCKHCYYPSRQHVHELPLDTAKRLFEEAAERGVKQIILSGGEPMLHSRIVDLVRTCRATNEWFIRIVSNGTMPAEGEDAFDRIMEQIDDLQISIDGIDADTHDAIRGAGSYARATRTFLRLYDTEADVRRGISFTPTPENIDQIPKLNKLGYHLSADYIHLNHPKPPADPVQREAFKERGFFSQDFLRQAITNFRRLYVNMLGDRKDAQGLRYRPLHLDGSFNYAVSLIHVQRLENCGAGITQLGFDPDGAAFPCAALTGREECRLGEYPELSLEQLWTAGRSWNRSIFSVDRDPACSDCLYRYFCGGGCRAVGEALSDRDVFCSVIRECFDDFFKYVSQPEKEYIERVAPAPKEIESC
jgi:radical SAM protein with 4Fe4S-binding SPASM domain